MNKHFSNRNKRSLGGLLFGLLLLSVSAMAVHDIQPGSLSAYNLSVGASFTVTDSKYEVMHTGYDWQHTQFANTSVENQLMFYVHPDYQQLLSTTANPSVKVDITYDYYDNTTQDFKSTTITNVTLALQLGGTKVKDKAIYTWQGAHKVKVTVKELTAGNTTLAAALVLSASIDVERYYILASDNYSNPANISKLSNGTETLAGNLPVTWEPMEGAEYYDLEWAYVDDIKGDGTRETDLSKIAPDVNLFKYNSTRVSVKASTYEIPLVYEAGQILYRVRAAGKIMSGTNWKYTYTQWSANDNYTNLAQFPHKYSFNGFRAAMNWQYSASFSEEGKNKVSVNYFDGTLRNRQMVTRSTSENKAIVGETFYDNQGRPAVQVLPVPTKKTSLDYKPKFNASAGGVAFSRDDFDKDNDAVTADCQLAVKPLLVDSGASRYYSAKNNFTSGTNTSDPSVILYKEYIPDAEGYPFTHNQYAPDNTGRIVAQAGVGKNHQINSGHETKYFFGKPKTGELERFFGSEVGEANNYKKDAVRDANGQMSVSYLDAQGKVIATALAGNTPNGLTSIGGAEKNYTSTLIDAYSTDSIPGSAKVNYARAKNPSNKFGQDQLSMRYEDALLVTTDGDHTFEYTANLHSLEENCSPAGQPQTHCYDCVVHVEMSLIDKCGDEKFDQNLNKKYGDVTETCQESTIPKRTETVALKTGSYQLNKTYRIDEEALNIQTAKYLDTTKCLAKFSTFYLQEKQIVDATSDCNLNCQKCQDRINAYVGVSDADKLKLIERYCAPFCSDKSQDCAILRSGMLADLSPEGQYGRVVENVQGPTGGTQQINVVNQNGQSTVSLGYNGFPAVDDNGFPISTGATVRINPSVYNMSIFNEANSLPKKTATTPSWRNPLNSFGNYTYNGQVYMVPLLVKKSETGTITSITPAITNSALLVDASVTPGGCPSGVAYCTVAKNLANVTDFLNEWKDEFAEALLPYHPEYCYLAFCNSIQTSNDFDQLLLNTTTIEAAMNNNLVPFVTQGGVKVPDATKVPNFLGTSRTSGVIDPFFLPTNTNVLDYWYKHMQSRMTGYVTTDQVLGNGSNTYSIWEFANWITNCPGTDGVSCPYTSTCFGPAITTTETWLRFRSFYLSEKKKIVYEVANRYAASSTNGCYSGCIGKSNFSPSYLQAGYEEWKLGFQCGDANCYYADFWARLRGHKSCDWVCQNVWVPNASIQYYNPKQTCYIGNKDLLANYARRAYAETTPNPSSASTQTCVVPLFDTQNPPTTIEPTMYAEVDCPVQSVDYMKAGVAAVDQAMYEECGLCPLARHLTELLDTLTRAKKLNMASTCLQLTCSDGKRFPQLTKELEAAFTNNLGGQVYWTSSLAGNTLTGSFRNAACGSNSETPCSLQLRYLGNDPTFDWTKLVKICCLSYTPSTNGNVYDFTVEAHVPNTNPQAIILTKKFILNGSISCFPIYPCAVPPRCEPSLTVSYIREFLNKLLYKETVSFNGNTVNKVNHLNTGDANIDLTGVGTDNKLVPFSAYYEFEVRDLVGKNVKDKNGNYTEAIGNIQWASSVNAQILQGRLLNAGSAGIIGTINLQLGGIDATNIVRVVNIRPDFSQINACSIAAGCSTGKFFADVMVKSGTGGQLTTTTLAGDITGIGVSGACKPVRVLSGVKTAQNK